jgi:hypothetical protein
VSPSYSIIRIEGENIVLDEKKQVELQPGTYTADVIRLNFSTVKVDFVVESNNISDVNVLLNPVNNEGSVFLLSEKEKQIREEVSFRISLEKSKKLEEINTLVNYLPVYNELFRIDYGVSIENPEDSTKIAYYITTDTISDRETAIKWIRDKGIDPDSLEIYYRFYE